MKVLVTGPTGFLGRALVPRLLAEGHDVRALVRRTPPALRHERLESVTGDVLDAESVDRAVAGVDAIVHLATASAREGSDIARAVNVEGTRHLVESAKRHGVKRFVFTSTISTTRARMGPYGRTKRIAEELVAASGLDWVTLRPSLVYGSVDTGLVAMLAGTIRKLPVVPVIGSGELAIDPIHLDDVCAVIAQCLVRGDVVGRTYDLLGPERTTFNAFVDRLSGRLGLQRPRLHLPGGLMLLGASILGRLMKSPPISTDNVIGMISPAAVEGGPARRDFAIRWTTLDEGLRALGPDAETGGDGAWPVPEGAPPSPRPRRPVRVAVVGLGRMGLAHTSVLATIPDCTIVGLVDPFAATGKSLRGMGHRARWYESLEALFAVTRPDAVFVCAPQNEHWPLARKAIEAGVAVFVEKPLAHTLADAEALAALARAKGIPVSCGYTLAYWPIFAAAASALEAGAIGPLRGVRASMFLSQVFGPRKGWMYDAARSGGGVVANVSSHLLFLLEWYFGTPRTVVATAKRLHTQVEDELSAVMTLPGGTEVRFETSWSVPGYPLSDVRVEAEGANGRLVVSADALELELHEPRGGRPAGRTVVRPADLPQPARFELNGEGYYLEDARFLEWVTGGPPAPTGVEVALRVQRTMDALYRSAAAGGERVEIAP